MSNRVARESAKRQTKRQKRRVEKDALTLVRSAHLFVDLLNFDGPLSGDARHLLKLVERLAHNAARFDGMADLLELIEDMEDDG